MSISCVGILSNLLNSPRAPTISTTAGSIPTLVSLNSSRGLPTNIASTGRFFFKSLSSLSTTDAGLTMVTLRPRGRVIRSGWIVNFATPGFASERSIMAFTFLEDDRRNRVAGPLMRTLMDSSGFLMMMREVGMFRKSNGTEMAVSPVLSLMTKYHSMTANRIEMSFKERFLVKKPFKKFPRS